MERRESTKKNDDREKTTPRPSHVRSRQENGEREKPENFKEGHRKTRDRRGRRKVRENRSNLRKSKSLKNDDGKKLISRRKKIAKEMGISDMSNTITKRTSRRQTRTSINLQGNNNKRIHKSANIPVIPRRVFKALHILRHEKLIRAVSRYLKPAIKE